MGSSSPPIMLVVSTSAHPSPAFVARDLGAQLIVLLDRVSEHGKAHGLQLLSTSLLQEITKAERAKVDASNKRLRAEDLSFSVVEAPAVQTRLFSEVEAKPNEVLSGVDTYPPLDVFETTVKQLEQEELGPNGLLAPAVLQGNCKGLIATKYIGEGDVLQKCPCLIFKSIESLTTVLNQGGNAAIADGLKLKVAIALRGTA